MPNLYAAGCNDLFDSSTRKVVLGFSAIVLNADRHD